MTNLCEASRGVFHSDRVGSRIKRGNEEYNISFNEFVDDIETEIAKAQEEGYSKLMLNKQIKPSGYLFKLEPIKGASNKLVGVYYAKKPLNSAVGPKKIGFEWAVSPEGANLKPQSFNLEEKWYSLSDFYDKMQSELAKREDLDSTLREYLMALIDYFTFKDKETKEQMSQFDVVRFPHGEIKKNFGEIIGPFFVTNQEFGVFNDLGLDDTAEVYFPLKGNEPLVDYKIRIKRASGSEEIFSAKSGVLSNTIKSRDLLTLADDVPSLRDDLPKEYKVLTMLDKHSMKNGPIFAANAIGVEGVTDGFVEDWINNTSNTWEFNPEIHQDFVDAHGVVMDTIIKNVNRKKSKYKDSLSVEHPTQGFIRYTIEKILAGMSGNELKFSRFFEELAKKVNYISLEKIKDGIPWFKHIEPEPDSDTVVLRTKNGIGNVNDKMGITPPKGKK